MRPAEQAATARPWDGAGNRRRLRLVMRELRRAPAIPLLMLLLFAIVGALSPFLVLEDPSLVQLDRQLTPPFWQAGGSWAAPLGTDQFGRDLLSRIIVGARLSLVIGIMAVAIGATIGTAAGITAGFLGGVADAAIMRLVDLLLAFPMILLALVLAVIVGPSVQNLIFVIAFLLWSRYARVIRGEVLAIKQLDFITMARATGASKLRIMGVHILPNVANTIIILVTLQVGSVILIESSLSFLGAGVPPPAPAWGLMVASGRDYVVSGWWVSGMPGFAILLVVLSMNLVGDWLTDRLDPRRRRSG